MNKLVIPSLVVLATLTGKFHASAQENVPAKVKSAAEGKAGGDKVVKWVQDKGRGRYVAVLSDGSVMTIALDGKWLNTATPVLENKLPARVTATVDGYVRRGYEADNYLFVQDAAEGTFYTVDISSDDDDATLFINAEGKVLKKESR
jgi:hypothetical protein